MPAFDRHVWRLAGRIADRLAQLPRQAAISLDHAVWMSARHLVARLDQSADRHWRCASRHLRWQLLSTVRRLQTSLGTTLQQLSLARPPEPPSQRSIYEDLLATREECNEFQFDLRQQSLSVTTRPITLEEIALGQFRIQLDLTDLSEHVQYEVIAVTPCYSVTRPDCCHPHVLDKRLCEGDAGAPLECALRTGRFGDFFQIIEQTLRTYNSDSAYTSLDAWVENVLCHACGDRISAGSSDYCADCDSTTCDRCSAGCVQCGGSLCASCVQRCPTCEEALCAGCATTHSTDCRAADGPI